MWKIWFRVSEAPCWRSVALWGVKLINFFFLFLLHLALCFFYCSTSMTNKMYVLEKRSSFVICLYFMHQNSHGEWGKYIYDMWYMIYDDTTEKGYHNAYYVVKHVSYLFLKISLASLETLDVQDRQYQKKASSFSRTFQLKFFKTPFSVILRWHFQLIQWKPLSHQQCSTTAELECSVDKST